MAARQRADRLTYRPEEERARLFFFRIRGGCLLAFAAVERHVLPCASRREENIIKYIQWITVKR